MSQLRIAFVGDTMCGDSFYLLGRGAAANIDKYGSDFLSPEIVSIFSSHDIVLCNIECVLSDVGRRENSLRSLHMRGRPQTAKHLAKWGITAAHVANNHILEQGLDAAIDTVRQLESAGIRTVGAGKDGSFQSGIEPLHLRFGDQTVAIIGACFHKGQYAFSSDLTEVLTAIKAEAEKKNTVIVSVHWGDELIDRPSTWQKQVSSQFIDAGALLVIGHHPHVVQGIVSYGKALTAYSLGNFIFDGNSEATGWSVILSLTISQGQVLGWEAIPIVSDMDCWPSLAKGESRDKLRKEVLRRCDLAEKAVVDVKEYEREYASEVRSLETKSRHQLWLDILRGLKGNRLVYWPQILWRPIMRRIGAW